MKLLLEAYAEQKVFLHKLIRQQNDSLQINDKFPVSSVEKLIELDGEISSENKHVYVSIFYHRNIYKYLINCFRLRP